MSKWTRTWALVGALACASPAAALADTILVGAPVFNNYSSWVTQSGVPPAGFVFNLADQFALTSQQQVTSIHASLYGTSTVPPAQFTLALVDDLTSVSPLYSGVFAAPAVSTLTDFALNINAMLAAGTYYLRLTTGGFVGWGVADATQFVTANGTIADGIWQQAPVTGTWSFQGSGGSTNVLFPHPGMFSVLGPDDEDGEGETGVPEPENALLFLLASGFIATVAVRRKRALQIAPAR